MPARSTQFQRLLTAMHACISPIGTVQESGFLLDLDTGNRREIDILITVQQPPYEIHIGIEVNEKSRRSSVTWVESMLKKHERLPTDKLILISQKGYTEAALKKASAHNVEAITLEDATALDWPLAIEHFRSGHFELFDLNWDCSLHLEGNKEWYKPRLNSLAHMPNQDAMVSVQTIVMRILSEPRLRTLIMDHVVSRGEKQYYIEYKQAGARFQMDTGKLIPRVKLGLEITVAYRATPFEYAVKALKGKTFSLGQSVDPEQSFCFALTKATDGSLEGVLYENGRFRRLDCLHSE